MLPWWGWLVLWTVLLVGSVVWLGVLGWGVWGRAKALGRELSPTGDLVSDLEARLDAPGDVVDPPVAATQPPHRVRAQYRDQRADQRARRRVRRALRMPPWARVD